MKVVLNEDRIYRELSCHDQYIYAPYTDSLGTDSLATDNMGIDNLGIDNLG